MTFQDALTNEIFWRYGILAACLIVACLTFLLITKHFFKKNFDSVWKIYKGWLFIVPVVFFTIAAGREVTIVAVTVIAILGFKEFARATGLYYDWWLTIAVYILITAMAVLTLLPDPRLSCRGWFGMFRNFPVFAVAFILTIPIVRNKTKGQLQSVALAILGFIYMGWMFFHLAFLANSSHPYGYLLFLIFAVQINDISAYICGKLFGKKKFRSEISPNKTWGGAIGAMGVSLLMPWLLGFSFSHFGAFQKVLAGLIIGVGGQMGDLSISIIKRDLGIKDMGAVIPGHGGVLDRIDSLIFTAPFYLHMINWFYGIYA